MHRKSLGWLTCGFGLACVLANSAGAWAGGGCLEIRNKYFWDPQTADYFIPRGIAYQTWNPPVGADQTFEQLEYDLIEFKKLYANSVRCEMVWNQLEPQEGQFDFSKPDYLVAKAEELGFKLFVLIGFQYAPSWFTNHSGWLATNNQGAVSVVLNYEHPGARQAYSNYIAQVTSRYRTSTTVGAWILGNEYSYYDLWNTNHVFLGYDPISVASYHSFLSNQYGGNLTALNTNYDTGYLSFDEVEMPLIYPPDRNNPAYHDLIKWREYSIGEYVAVGAVAAKLADPNHLRSYSMIGGLFIVADALYTCEDARTIVGRCAAARAPLDFWSINNYAWASLTKELRSGDFGISKHLAVSGLPVMVSETGFSTTDADSFPDSGPRQGDAVPSAMWEALMSGAIGTHIFTWNDREMYGGETFMRERGFGIASQTRLPKLPTYPNVREMFRRMEALKVDRLFGGSVGPPADLYVLWSDASKMGWCSANQENAFVWSALKRLGYQPAVLDDEGFERGDYTNGAALLLSRCYQMKPEHLDQLVTNALARGIRVHANADLPGQFDTYHRPNPRWTNAMEILFGLDVTKAYLGLDPPVVDKPPLNRLDLTVRQPLGALTNGYRNSVWTAKIWHGIKALSGTTIATHTGNQGTQPPLPALQIKDSGTTRTAVNTFAVGDLNYQTDQPPTHDWDFHYDWLRAIYRDWFGMAPVVDLTGPGAQYVIPDYRLCATGTTLISLLNANTNRAVVTLTAHTLLDGRAIEDLTNGGLLDTHSSGVLSVPVEGDQCLLLYAYTRTNGVDTSLVNPNPNKIWFQSAPGAVWPNDPGYEVTVGYDVTENLDLVVDFESSVPTRRIYVASPVTPVSGKGATTVTLRIPSADLGDVLYVSSVKGGVYRFRARLQRGTERLAEVSVPVRLLWGVRPQSLPATLTPGARYEVPVEWEELPAYEPDEATLPLSRAALWQLYRATAQYYDVVLELRDATDQVVAADHHLTNQGSGTNTFSITVPSGASGPFRWLAYLRPSPGASHSLWDSFEERTPGSIKDEYAYAPYPHSLLSPWVSYNYPTNGAQQWWDEGVGTNASDGQWSAFLVITNPPPPLGYSGFGIAYTYPETWSLPNDFQQWTNYAFSCDVLDTFGNASELELQVKDDLGGVITLTKPYNQQSNVWDTISAPLSQFQVMTNAPASGYFNQARVQSLVINVQMESPNAEYAANFDRIRFTTPTTAVPATTSHDVFDSFEDRPQGAQAEFLLPWNPYSYEQPGFNPTATLASGVHAVPSEGFRSAFLIVQNPANPGGWSGFGLYRDFPSAWALPPNTNLWTNYVFSFDFKEANGYPCTLELQVKSASNHWVSVFKDYVGSNQWDTIRATLADFRLPPGSQGFESNHVQTLALNISMLVKNVVYSASFDNIRFDGPDTPLPPELAYATFSSAADFLRDSDGDGIPDAYETGTGVFRSPTDTGTDPQNPDTDGDGLSDGQELVAGTDPNSASDVFRLESVERLPEGDVRLSWFAYTNRLYTVYATDELLSEGGSFVPLPNLMNLAPRTNGMAFGTDSSASASPQRYYRISVELQLP